MYIFKSIENLFSCTYKVTKNQKTPQTNSVINNSKKKTVTIKLRIKFIFILYLQAFFMGYLFLMQERAGQNELFFP